MDEFDAYAPPQAETETGALKKKIKRKKAAKGAIAEAIAQLNEHLADANAVAHDRKEAGGRLRGVTIGFIVFMAFVLLTTAALLSLNASSRWEGPEIAGVALAGFFVFLTVVLVVVDLMFLARDKPASPEETLKHFFKGIAMGRLGYAWAMLCPTAREETVYAPELGPLPITHGSFLLRSTNDLKDYAKSFARPGNGQMRTMQIKRLTLLNEDGDVAVVEVTALFQAWPQWAQIICVVGFVIMRALGAILFVILFFSLRKTHEVVFRKTLIRGSNSLWYVYAADLLEGAANRS